jgi:hypothetical protein
MQLTQDAEQAEQGTAGQGQCCDHPIEHKINQTETPATPPAAPRIAPGWP